MNVPDIDKVFRKKFDNLKQIEEDFVNKQLPTSQSEKKPIRQIYSCNDGFVILRLYSQSSEEIIQIFNTNDNVNNFVKAIPFSTRSHDKIKVNLNELLKQSMGIELRIGQTIDIGSKSDGIKIGAELEIDGFVFLSRSYEELSSIKDTLEDIFSFLDLKQLNINLKERVENLMYESEFKDLEKQELINELKTSKANIKTLNTFAENHDSETSKISLPEIPFRICVLGEVTEISQIRNELNKYFEKIGLRTTDWDIDFYNNTKLQNGNILKSLRKGQSRFNLILTGQIFNHSSTGNSEANLLTELKKEKYISHRVACSPTELLSYEKTIKTVHEYLATIVPEQ